MIGGRGEEERGCEGEIGELISPRISPGVHISEKRGGEEKRRGDVRAR